MSVPPDQCSDDAKRFGITGAAPTRANAPPPTSGVQGRQGERGDADGPNVLPIFVRHRDLLAAGIVGSWVQLARLQTEEGFPAGILLSANTRVWKLGEIRTWLASRPTARKVPPPRKRGRPRNSTDAAAAS